MNRLFKYQLAGFLIAASVCFAKTSEAKSGYYLKSSSSSESGIIEFTLEIFGFQTPDTIKLPYPIKPEDIFASDRKTRSSFDLESPSNITITVEYDPKAKQYIIYEKVGKYNIKPPRVMSEEEYRNYQFENSMREYWRKKSAGESFNAGSGLLPRMQVGGETFDRIFGSNTIEIIPEGSAELTFGLNHSKSLTSLVTQDQQKSTTFDFKSKIQMNVNGKIGEKLTMAVQYNTEATFDFENNVKVEYTGYEDEIIQKIEAGNVSLPLPGTLITGSQSLFGFKTHLKFGKLNVTTIFSKQNGQSQVIDVKGGAQTTEFSVNVDDYEANKHFFLSPYFRSVYNKTLENLPLVTTLVNITKVEVWVTNTTQENTNSRNIIAFSDLGEATKFLFNPAFSQIGIGDSPYNELNNLYSQLLLKDSIRSIKKLESNLKNFQAENFRQGKGYEKIQIARKLQPNEYAVNAALGYITLLTPLASNQQLAVAYEYTVGAAAYKVGEFSTEGIEAPKALILKLLMGEVKDPKIPPTWNLMMKNIYKLSDAYQVSRDEFFLDVYYHDDRVGTDLKYIPGVLEDRPLIKILNLDNLNAQNDPKPDGVFDFIDDIPGNPSTTKIPVTINSTNGRVIFPVLEPFGKDLRSKIGNNAIADQYVYQEIYDSTLTKAQKVSRKNKFKLMGSLKSSASSEIYLNAANIPKGSVVVTAGGAKLEEGIDYTVDYNLGSLRIIKTGLIESGMPIRITLENNALFNFQTKTLVGSHFDYKISDRFNMGATILNLTERPLTNKVSIGNEAISNTIWGLNTSFQSEAGFLTKMVDLLPFIQTKEKSTITFDAEFAQLIPGYSKAIGKDGTVFIDDFESSSTPIEISQPRNWKLASVPMGQALIPNAALVNDLRSGFNRAHLSWFNIDPLFLRDMEQTPSYIRRNDKFRNSHWVREIYERELFPDKNTPQGQPTNLAVFNLAYYPNERGPNNYNTNLDAQGFLANNKRDNWAGIMSTLSSNSNFEALNISYIEFWLMDPFVYDKNPNGGDLYFNLGSMSEDILRDNEYSFEGGLPKDGNLQDTVTSKWGRFPIEALPNYFTTNTEGQKRQDAGLDGLNSRYDVDEDGINDEIKFFDDYLNGVQGIVNPTIFEELKKDPSNDDYMNFLDSYYTNIEAGIIDRYKRYNNTEGNSPPSTSNTALAASIYPDAEDVDGIPNMNEVERYFQYRIPLKKDEMIVGKNYITNKLDYEADLPGNAAKQKISWYQYKIPIDKPQLEVGDPTLSSISMIRMFLKGFEDTLNLRFAKLQLVRDEWKKYDLPMIEGQEGVPGTDLSNGSLTITAVNLEDNSSRTPINYILPPDLSRSTDPSQSQIVEQNEQSMEIKVSDLADGDARAAYKLIGYDIRKYRKLKMDVHAEAIPGIPLYDDELTIFLRMGNDNTDNYYEYEVPLKITPVPVGRYNNNSEADRLIVWPRENLLDVNLELLTDAKLARNDAMRKSGSTINMSTVFVQQDGENKIKVRGNPSLSDVKVLMIGIRNPKAEGNTQSKSAVVWVNELRVSNTSNKAGWAANARLSAKLADLGMVTIAGATSKPGFGSIESKVANRTSEDFYQYDLSATLEMGRFFSQKSGIKVPLYIGFSESFANPEYNPLDPDIPLRTAINNATTKWEKDSIRRVAQDYTKRKSINLTNVKIDRQDAKSWPLALSNFSVSYSFNETFSRNIKTDHRVNREIRGALTYNYNTNSKPIVPLRKSKLFNSKYLRLIKDFNFNPIPSQFSFRTDLTRNYFEQQLRNVTNTSQIFDPTYSKDFIWNRVYSLNWDLSQSLKFDFNATNLARIDEPDGIVDKQNRDKYTHWRDSVFHNILNFGRNTEYNHQFNLTYNVPLNKIPFVDWMALSAKYSGNYRWEAGVLLSDTSRFDPGNEIQNSNTIQLVGQLNMVGLYNKVGYLKQLNQKFDQIARGTPPKKPMKTVTYEEKELRLKANSIKSITHKLKTENVTIKVYSSKGAELKVKTEVKSDERITIKSDVEYENVRVVVEGKIPEKNSPIKVIVDNTLRVLLGFKNISLSISETRGTFFPGYKPTTKYLGLNDVNGVTAPGFAFISGWQDPEFAWNAINNGWLTKDTTFNSPFRLNYSQSLNFRALYEPIPNLKVEISALRTYAQNRDAYYRADASGHFDKYNPLTNGNFSMSIISVGSAFSSAEKVFDEFRNSRLTVANRLADDRVANSANGYIKDGPGSFPAGYSELSQEVLIPSFLAAYTNYTPRNVPLNNFPLIPMPNWQITYDGLAKIQPFKNFLRTFSVTHGYRSVYSIGAYALNSKYEEQADGYSYVENVIKDFISKREISNISITEQFTPLIGLDMNWINSLTSRLEVKTGRLLAMSFSNNQLTQTNSWEYIIGGGYRFENMPIIFGSAEGKQRTLKSDLRLRLDFSLRKNETVLHKLVEQISIPQAGTITTSIKASADYLISTQVTFRAFFDWGRTKPIASGQGFPTTNSSFGFSLRFVMI